MSIRQTKAAGKSIAQAILGKQLRRVAGNLASIIDGGLSRDSSESAPINRFHQSTNMLSFPIDVGADPGIGNHGHYIMFYINEQTNAVLSFDDAKKRLKEFNTSGIDNMVKELNDKYSDPVRLWDTKSDAVTAVFGNQQTINDQILEGLTPEFIKKSRQSYPGGDLGIGTDINTTTGYTSREAAKTNTTISIHRPPTRRLSTCISMYMPASVKVSYKANYTDTSIGSLTQAASQIVGEYLNTGEVSGDTVQKNAKDVFTAVGIDGLVNLLSNVPSLGGAREALEMGMGSIVADRMEMAFKGIDKRKFQYLFKMMPRSEAEAEEIRKIINMFKINMLPEMGETGARGRLMTYPNTFNIHYMYQNHDNNYLNKVSECYLESMEVDYGGDRFKAFDGNADGAPTVETTLTLNFGEIELITRERAIEGF